MVHKCEENVIVEIEGEVLNVCNCIHLEVQNKLSISAYLEMQVLQGRLGQLMAVSWALVLLMVVVLQQLGLVMV